MVKLSLNSLLRDISCKSPAQTLIHRDGGSCSQFSFKRYFLQDEGYVKALKNQAPLSTQLSILF